MFFNSLYMSYRMNLHGRFIWAFLLLGFNDQGGGNLGSDKESYFFCLRGRKYKNSTRPNRVTSSGFWKATGIDKQINTQVEGGKTSLCIGLKKSLVYYRGSSGKGTKTDWMMHEYRLLGDHQRGMTNSKTNPKCTQDMVNMFFYLPASNLRDSILD